MWQTLILFLRCDFETVAEDPCCDEVVTIRPTHVHGCHHPPCLAMSSNALGTAYQHLHQSHPRPLPYMPCHLVCLGIAHGVVGDVRRRRVGWWLVGS